MNSESTFEPPHFHSIRDLQVPYIVLWVNPIAASSAPQILHVAGSPTQSCILEHFTIGKLGREVELLSNASPSTALAMTRKGELGNDPGKEMKKKLHQPGIEPGLHRWQRCILPLDH